MVSVEHLSACARLADSLAALERAQAAAAAGDESWEQWLGEHARGEAVLVCLELTLELKTETGPDRIEARSGEMFIESGVQLPIVEHQLAELASGEFANLSEELVERGHSLGRYELSEMYVHVELDEELRRHLREAHRQLATAGGQHDASGDEAAAAPA